MSQPTLPPGTPILAGDRLLTVPADLAARYRPGDRLFALPGAGDLLLVPGEVDRLVGEAVRRAHEAFAAMAGVPDEAITRFYEAFASRLEDPSSWAPIAAANEADVESARGRGRSTTRLAASPKMRAEMVASLRGWRDAPTVRGRVLETVRHDGWEVQQVAAPLGVVGFVFEGRPNVFADATGVLRGGNTVVFRIGSDALGTARAIVAHALAPALSEAGLPDGAAVLVESPERSAGWALFADPRLSLAVARGSGPAVAQLGAVARQAGIPVSLHGTGGAWLVADRTADAARFEAAVEHSLDRKVCNTLNVCLIHRQRTGDLVPRFLAACERAGRRRGFGYKLWTLDRALLPPAVARATTVVRRAEGDREEPLVELLPEERLGHEWEWEETPEVTLGAVEDLEQAIQWFNRYSPRFTASLLAEDPAAHERFWAAVDAPFVGNGFTRWVDGQYALGRPELGLSNWQHGRLLGRSAVLSGDSVFTVRTRMVQVDPDVHR